ncbi:MAG: UDP-2,3-diacylglucosamine diphosphatase [Bacteroidales bacterium]|nr:UDP-2,3-diacylglucosamine diphosphatase [Bacteroidales bacterium]
MNKDKIYFISDLHLGLHPECKSREREKLAGNWLEEIKPHARELYLLGDVFDFWHEYKHVVPRGFTRFLGKLAELADNGTKLYFFSGNHDVWTYGYFQTELGAEIHHKPLIREFYGKKYFLAHGDGIGKGELGYKLLIRIFRNKILQWLFARLHPNFALWLGKTWSKHSRYAKGIVAEEFAGEEGELQIQFAKKALKKEHFDFFIFGHRHIPYDIKLGEKARVINLGDWIYSFTYGELDEKGFVLRQYQGDGANIIYENYSLD